MSPDQAGVLAGRFRALADPTRVRLLNLLARHPELCVCDLQSNVGLSQPTISHHLALLRRAGLVAAESRGRWAFYRARPEAIRELSEALEVRPAVERTSPQEVSA